MIRLKISFILILLGTLANAQESNFNFKNKTMLIETTNGTFPIIDQGSGTTVLLLHGFPDSKELWKHQVPALVKAGYRVIAPDLRGYGKAPSPLEKEQYSVPMLMNDIMGILEALKLDKIHLVGHDWGAALSWQLAKYYPQKFISLTALSVGFPGNSAWSSMEQRQKSWYFYLFLQEGLAEKTFADYNWEFAKEFLSTHPDRDPALNRLKEGNALTTALNWYRGNMQYLLTQPNVDYTPQVEKPAVLQEKLSLPVLGIWSDLDMALTEAQMTQSTEFVTNFTYEKIEGAGHWMMLDKPTALNSLLLNFLNEIDQ